MAIHWRRIIDYVEADYLFAWPPMTEEELVTSLEFGQLLQAKFGSMQYCTEGTLSISIWPALAVKL